MVAIEDWPIGRVAATSLPISIFIQKQNLAMVSLPAQEELRGQNQAFSVSPLVGTLG
jgi:hypothetical protein